MPAGPWGARSAVVAGKTLAALRGSGIQIARNDATLAGGPIPGSPVLTTGTGPTILNYSVANRAHTGTY